MSDYESSPPPSPVSSDNDASDVESQVSDAPESPRSPTPEPTPPPAPKKRKRASSKTKASSTTSGSKKAAKKTKKTAKKPPAEAPQDPAAYKAPRGRPKSSGKSPSSKPKKEADPKQPRLKKADIEIPTRFDNTEEGWKKFCVYCQEGLGKMTYKKYLTYNKRSRAAELKRLKNSNKKFIDNAATLAEYKDFLRKADAEHFSALDGVWLMNHGFDGSLSYKAIRSGAAPPDGERDYRYDATLMLFNECLRRKVQPLGIVSGNTNETVYKEKVDEDGKPVLAKNGKPIRMIESFQFAFSVPDGEQRVWVGTASRFRGGFEKHPLSCSNVVRQKFSDDVRLGVGEPMVTFS